jgi:hypothetical protein
MASFLTHEELTVGVELDRCDRLSINPAAATRIAALMQLHPMIRAAASIDQSSGDPERRVMQGAVECLHALCSRAVVLTIALS